MNKDYCDITLILDESGSMWARQQDVIGGVNGFLKSQREQPGKCTVSLFKFNTTCTPLYVGKPVGEVEDLNTTTYYPGGNTALLDTVGFAIDEAGSRFRNMKEDERPAKVIMVIVTDGEENSSKVRTKQSVREAIERQRNVYKWEFVFLGANVDAFAEAGGLGILGTHTYSYMPTPVGVANAYATLATNTTSYRSGQTSGMAFTQEQRDHATSPV